MNIQGQFILLRLYMDVYACNNPLGSSKGKHKVLGFYCSAFTSLEAGSQRSSVITIALVYEKDIQFFGLAFCLKKTIEELSNLVKFGIYDKKLKKTLEVRVICSLGDNLEQVQIAGIKQNFSTMEHSCRKCYCSRTDLRNADTYAQIHAENHIPRTDTELQNDYLESKELGVQHVNGCRINL